LKLLHAQFEGQKIASLPGLEDRHVDRHAGAVGGGPDQSGDLRIARAATQIAVDPRTNLARRRGATGFPDFPAIGRVGKDDVAPARPGAQHTLDTAFGAGPIVIDQELRTGKHFQGGLIDQKLAIDRRVDLLGAGSGLGFDLLALGAQGRGGLQRGEQDHRHQNGGDESREGLPFGSGHRRPPRELGWNRSVRRTTADAESNPKLQ
jgi:hypothetical protein